MANEQLRHGTELANAIEQTWRPRFARQANEEMVVGKNFDQANEGVEKIAGQLNIRKIVIKTAQTIASPASLARPDLVYNQDVEQVVTVTPTAIYSGVQIQRPALSRIIARADLMAAMREQIQAALAAKIDNVCAALATSLSTNVLGGAGQDIGLSLLTSAIGKLTGSAKSAFQIGVTPVYLCVHPAQVDDVLSTNQFTAANVRGDSSNPQVRGWVWNAYGVELGESGNISTSGGVAHNLLRIKPSHVLGYNEQPNILDPQEDGLITVLLAYAEFGAGELFDEYAADIQTNTA